MCFKRAVALNVIFISMIWKEACVMLLYLPFYPGSNKANDATDITVNNIYSYRKVVGIEPHFKP